MSHFLRTRQWIHAWLMLAPSLALLAVFTHWPAISTIIDSVYSTPRPRRPSRFVGPANFEQMAADPIFWQAMWNNLWFALGTIPTSIALALLMAVPIAVGIALVIAAGILAIGPSAVTLAEAESLEAHANAVRLRLAEAARLGFTRAIVPLAGSEELRPVPGIQYLPVSHLGEAVGAALPRS